MVVSGIDMKDADTPIIQKAELISGRINSPGILNEIKLYRKNYFNWGGRCMLSGNARQRKLSC
jgi:hypothetical protein